MYEGNLAAPVAVRPKRTAEQVEVDREVLAHIRVHVEQTGTAWNPILLSDEWAASVARLREREDIIEDHSLGGFVPAPMRAKLADRQSRMLSYIKWRIDVHGRPVKLRVLTREKAQAVVRLLLTKKILRNADGTVSLAEDVARQAAELPVGRVKG